MTQNLKGGISRTSKIVAVLAVASVEHRVVSGFDALVVHAKLTRPAARSR
jgi:hypothetical protein